MSYPKDCAEGENMEQIYRTLDEHGANLTLNYYPFRPPHVPVATIFKISRHMYIRNALLTRLLKILQQPTTGFTLLGARQMCLIRLERPRGSRLPENLSRQAR
ncbi:hypothetical protein CSKR_112187 [Clonorchis sinensis]|uniref:Uncharacterized protein n=1 Tax=Clonorchis sinensis TaxID=79923 RepID=A0A3R7H4N6_CLOSI|nr:hypothetical protein CSKR_112187 [Clonorchis sinensis]